MAKASNSPCHELNLSELVERLPLEDKLWIHLVLAYMSNKETVADTCTEAASCSLEGNKEIRHY